MVHNVVKANAIQTGSKKMSYKRNCPSVITESVERRILQVILDGVGFLREKAKMPIKIKLDVSMESFRSEPKAV